MSTYVIRIAVFCALFLLPRTSHANDDPLTLHERGYLSARGVEVLVFNNWYSGLFSDSKLSGVEIIHHGVRTATNGDVRLSNTPEQWDPIPQMEERLVDTTAGRIEARLSYPEYDFEYRIVGEPHEDGVRVSVHLDRPVPPELAGRAGFNMEFLPSEYFGKSYSMDGHPGLFPRDASGAMYRASYGMIESAPLASGSVLVLAPEDPERRVTIDGQGAVLSLYDGRNQAQNGWYVVRSLIPEGETGEVIQWIIKPHRIPEWTRTPMIAHSQIGYHPSQEKSAIIELDPNYDGPGVATLYQILPDGSELERKSGRAEEWGPYLRYQYSRFDFSDVRDPGLYVLEFDDVRSRPFRVAGDVYSTDVWQSSLDTFLPVQMDHMFVNDRYRVWHGASHLDDALQAPVDHEHFDLYAQGPTTDTDYQPGEHIPGLNIGGWYDAGDYDIRTQSQYATISSLVHAHETFGIDWDQTTVRQDHRYVDLRKPDGIPDIVQQIEHGTLALLAQYRAVGHAIPGIVAAHIHQYTHLGDGLTKTDNLIYDPSLDSLEVDGDRSGTFDDRWAFTTKSTPLDYGSIAALAGASRVLRDYNEELAEEALQTAIRVWESEQANEPVIFRHGNTTGGRLEDEEFKATVELLITTEGGEPYRQRVMEMLPFVEQNLFSSATNAVRAIPYMDDAYRDRIEQAVQGFLAQMSGFLNQNPFQVPITTGGWGGAGAVIGFGVTAHVLHREFPDLVGPEHVFRAMNYILGTHPANNVSMVSGVGAHSKTTAYGANRADFSFIPGGVVPGIVIVQPDLPELQLDWPFLWYENEYVITPAASFIYLGNAVNDLLN